jgi:hypothetical protein
MVNANFKTTVLNVLFGLFVIKLLWLLVNQFFIPFDYRSWQLSEFLINYQGGFVRRGIIGEPLLFLSRRFHINLEWTVKIISLLLFVLTCTFFIRAFHKRGYPLYLLPLCFFMGSSVLFSYYGTWVRKDFLMILILIAICLIYKKNTLPIFVRITIINLLAVFAILAHEIFAFFSLPVLVLLLMQFFSRKQRRQLTAFGLACLSLLPSFIAFILVTQAHGDTETAAAIWASYGLPPDAEPAFNAVGALGWTTEYGFNYHLESNLFTEYMGIFGVLFTLITIPVVYYLAVNAPKVFGKRVEAYSEKRRKILASIVIFQFLCLLPAFLVLSCDYMRLYMYWMLSSFAIFLTVPDESLEALFPRICTNWVCRINSGLDMLLPPSRTLVAILMLFAGVCPVTYGFSIWNICKSSVFIQLLDMFSNAISYTLYIIS